MEEMIHLTNIREEMNAFSMKEEMHSSSLVAHLACPPESKRLKKVVPYRGVEKAIPRARHSYPSQIGLILTLHQKEGLHTERQKFSLPGCSVLVLQLVVGSETHEMEGQGV